MQYIRATKNLTFAQPICWPNRDSSLPLVAQKDGLAEVRL